MKRCKSKMRGARALSPYAKARKIPFRYSDTYQAWRAAVTSGNEAAAERHAAEHMRKFGGRHVNA